MCASDDVVMNLSGNRKLGDSNPISTLFFLFPPKHAGILFVISLGKKAMSTQHSSFYIF